MQLFNSLGRKREEFVPLTPGKVKMYCCGPTVWDFLHIGNFRGPVVYNLLRNWLEHEGYQVDFVYNFTDVDDKIITRAQKEGVSSSDISEKYIAEFKADFASLGLRPANHNPRVTEHMNHIIQIIEKLIQAEKAYVVDGEVFYAVKSFPGYGQLSNRQIDDLVSGARVEINDKKRDPLDFTLWKPAKPGEPAWPSPWSEGRPGWHIECSAMNWALHGEQIDIHGGGMDLLFPHHENELAQTEGFTGKTFARYWVHNNMLEYDGQKMSKSIGNVWTMRSFLKEFPGEVYKFLILSAHYRSICEFSEKQIHQAIGGLARVYSAMVVAGRYASEAPIPLAHDDEFKKVMVKVDADIKVALNDDLNTPEVMAGIFEVVRSFNGLVKPFQKVSPQMVSRSQAFLVWVKHWGGLMALFQNTAPEFLKTLDDILLKQKSLDRLKIDQLVEARRAARVAKDFKKADEVRQELMQIGIEVMDSPEGTHWEVKK